MNKTHRIVWSDARQSYVVAHEKAASQGKPSSTRKAVVGAVASALMLLGAGEAMAIDPCVGATTTTISTAADTCALDTGGSVVIASGGSITDSYAVHVNGVTAGSITVNSGGLVDGTADTGIYLHASGRLTGALVNSGSINGLTYGVKLYVGTISGGVTNSGTISGETAIKVADSIVGNDIVNSKLIAGSSIGIDIVDDSTISGSIINTGTILGTDYIGLYVNGNGGNAVVTGRIENRAGGTISGKTYGINVTQGEVQGGITNAGLIRSTGGSGYGIAITNHGTVGSIVNQAGGTIRGASTGILVSGTSAITGSISNAGTIIGTANYGVAIGGQSATVAGFINSGSISGNFTGVNVTGTSTVTGGLTNSGTISGVDKAIYADGSSTLPNLHLTGSSAKLIGDVDAVNTDVFVKSGATFGNTNAFDVKSFTVESGALFNFGAGPHTTNGLATNGVKVSNGFTNSGTVAVAAGVTPTITGNYSQAAAGVFRTALSDAATYGKLNVSGNATLANGSVVDVVLGGTPGARIDGVIVAGTLTVTPANVTVTDNSVLYNFTASNTRAATELDLITAADSTGITTAAGGSTGSPALAGVAGALQTMFNTGIPAGMQPVFDLLATQTPAQAAQTLRQLLPPIQGASAQAGLNALHSMNKIIQSRIESNQGLSSGEAGADNYAWGRAFGNWGNQTTHEGVAGFDSRTNGLVLGVDLPVTPSVRAGAAFTYAKSNIESAQPATSSKVDVDTFEIIGYASQNLDPVTDINYQLDIGLNRADSGRLTPFGRARADFDALAIHGSVGIGRMFPLGAQSSVTPSLRADYARMDTEGYTEKGAGPVSLINDKSRYEEFLLTMDAKFAHQVNENAKLVGNLSAGYDFINEQVVSTSLFAGGGPAWKTAGLEVSPWVYRAGVGIIHDTNKGIEYSVRFDTEWRTSGYDNQTLSARVRWAF